MIVHVPSGWLMTLGACMVAVLLIQLLDALRVPKWAQWLGAAVLVVLAWVTFR